MTEKHHFLYVEDDPTSRAVMDMLVRYWFADAMLTIFEDSTDFITRLEGLSPEPTIIFLDIHMQPYSGFDMLNMIQEHQSYAGSTVIALTASVMNEEVQQLEAAGFNGAIAKPLDREVFPELVEQILDGKTVWYVS
jgi:CheY-like chemotaxis protein